MDYPSQRETRGRKFFFCGRKCKSEWNRSVPGFWKDKKIPFYSRPNKNILADKNPNWRGGRRVDKSGYILIYLPSHPHADGDGYVREHRLVVEGQVGRILELKEVVHHVNEQKSDNRPENLQLLSGEAEHRRVHALLRKQKQTS